MLGLFFSLIGALLCHFLGVDSVKKAGWITFGVSTGGIDLIYIIFIIISLAALYLNMLIKKVPKELFLFAIIII